MMMTLYPSLSLNMLSLKLRTSSHPLESDSDYYILVSCYLHRSSQFICDHPIFAFPDSFMSLCFCTLKADEMVCLPHKKIIRRKA